MRFPNCTDKLLTVSITKMEDFKFAQKYKISAGIHGFGQQKFI
jgi:hypothetical protein